MSICKFKNWRFHSCVPLFAGLKGYFVPLVVVFVVGIVFSSSFIMLSSNTIPLTRTSLSDSDSTDSSTVPSLLWTHTTNRQANAAPILAQGILYCSSDGYSSSYVYALNAASGATLWTADYYGFPMVDNGKLFVSDTRRVYVLDARSGGITWQKTISPGGGNNIGAPSVLVNDILYVCLESGIRALDATTGDRLWDYDGPIFVDSSPLVVDDVVYAGSFRTVYAFDARSDREIWKYTIDTTHNGSRVYHVSSLVLDDGVIYFCAGDGNAYALEADSGQEIWRYTYTSPREYSPISAPFFKDGLIYLNPGTGVVCALNVTDRAELWSSVIGEGALSVPAFYEGVLSFGSDDGTLYALNATSGFKLWAYPLSVPLSQVPGGFVGGVGSPVVCDGVLFVGCGEGVFALAVSSSFVLPSLPFYLPPFLVLLIVVVVVVVVVICCVCFYLLRRRKRSNKRKVAL
ncbi:MAG: PQQ-like beta-propeller repeat protein [Nitrososphaerota archaeon]|nr:PQQ-like beta-propeller repeat protein [Nitrososphaerota archaeon]